MSPFLITQREQEILNLIAGGYTSREIAEQLFISMHTVQTHRKKILKKMNMNKSIRAIGLAQSVGLIGEKMALNQ